MSDLQKAAQRALDVLEAWQKPFGPFFHLEEWPIKWTDHGAVTITLTPRLLRNRQRSGELQSVEQVELGKAHNAAIDRLRAALAEPPIDRLRAALAETKLSPKNNLAKSSIAHADGCWSWGPAHYACACAEIAKLKGWAK